MSLKLGRLPATRPAALRDLEAYTNGPLPSPPATREVPSAPYPMDGNDQIGDCTIAGVAHLLAAWDAEVHEHDPVPGEQAVMQEYFSLTGGPDSGLNEAEVLKTWHTSGLFGNTIAGYAPVNPKDLLQLHQAIAFYGGCYLGIECPESAQEQAEAGEPWTYVEGSPIVGGHCVAALGYGPNGGLHVASWGKVIVMEAGFMAHYLDEAWVILSEQMVQARRDALGINLEALQADLTRV